jgi:hypothetical protein
LPPQCAQRRNTPLTNIFGRPAEREALVTQLILARMHRTHLRNAVRRHPCA